VHEPEVAYRCDAASFKPAQTHVVRWLDVEDDFALLQAFHEGRHSDDYRFTPENARKWRDDGFTDAGVVEDGVLIARAARWTYSDEAWELAGVFTVPERRRRGLSRSVCSFVTAAILNAGRMATCHTGRTNRAMRGVAESLGYKLVSG